MQGIADSKISGQAIIRIGLSHSVEAVDEEIDLRTSKLIASGRSRVPVRKGS
jgi:hypothetical protein